jgi:hypothetical protein
MKYYEYSHSHPPRTATQIHTWSAITPLRRFKKMYWIALCTMLLMIFKNRNIMMLLTLKNAHFTRTPHPHLLDDQQIQSHRAGKILRPTTVITPKLKIR